jgi:Ca-activated chloride channel homolog
VNPVRFSDPWWLLLVLLVVPTIWLSLRWLLGMSGVRRASVITTRTLLLVLLALALAGASAPRQSNALSLIAVIDVSDSVRLNAPIELDADGLPVSFEDRVRSMLAAAANAREPDDKIGLVVFDAVAAASAMPTRADPTDRSLDVRYAEGTDIAQALRLAAAMLPADASGRLLLISDGNQTAGDALRVADSLATGVPVPVDVVPVRYRVEREVLVERVDAPPSAAAESTITVRMVLRATAPATGTLRLLYDEVPVDLNGNNPGTGRPLQLGAGQRVETAEVQLIPGRVHRFEAVWEPELSEVRPDGTRAMLADSSTMNNRARSFTVTPGTGSVLVVQNQDPTAQATTLVRTLTDGGLRVEVAIPETAPADLLAWQSHDLVILDGVAADRLSDSSQSALVAAVTELGTGLVMVGSETSFGAGGWQGSPIEELLPVLLDVPDRLVVPRAAVILILDSSGSMGQSVMGSSRSQQEIANEAAARAVSSMGKTDLVGVIRFSNSAQTVVELGPNDDPQATSERITSIRAGGGTNLLPALQLAQQQLLAADADIKHVVVLSDGRSRDENLLPPLAEAMAAQGISVTAISVGDESDSATMRLIALKGGGAYHEVIDPNRLPAVFLSAVRLVRSPLIREGAFTPVYELASPLTEGLPADLPDLTGLVLTRDREDQGVTMAMRAPDGSPLLAYWQTGLGRVGAFTSDADTWAAEWIDSPVFRRFWVQMARTLSRPQDDRRFALSAETLGDELRLRVEAYQTDGTPSADLDMPATVFAPGGRELRVRMLQTAPGLYEASVPASESGDYIAIARPTLGGQALPASIGGLSIPAGAEHRVLRSNDALLASIAERTGGNLLEPTVENGIGLFKMPERPTRRAWTPLWQPLLVAALAVLMLDIGTRRVAWDRWLSREFGAEFQAAARDSLTDRSEASARASSTLRSRKEPGRSDLSQSALDDQDAAAVLRDAQRRRETTERVAPVRTTPKQRTTIPATPSRAPSAPSTVEQKAGPSDESARTEESDALSLLAAKRRATKRFETDDDASSTN